MQRSAVSSRAAFPGDTNGGRAARVKNLLLLLLRCAITAALLMLAFRHANWRLMLSGMRQMNGVWFGLAILLLATQMVLAALGWRRITQVCEVFLSTAAALRYTLSAFF
jgi:hypothetical protein